MKDYYRTLGVLDDAEEIIIRAAYKALAQRYHPDKWKGDPQEANKRMSDINEAYDILSDSAKRKKYDEEYFRNRARDESTEEDESDANFISEEDENWKIAVGFFPVILDQFNELKKINDILANTFKTNLINSQDFKNSTSIKTRYEEEFLTKFYGNDKGIKLFAKKLLLSNHKNAALKVNKIVRLMGETITYAQLYKKIIDEFPEIADKKESVPEVKKDYSNDTYAETERELTCNNCGVKKKMYIKTRSLILRNKIIQCPNCGNIGLVDK
jgi:curved DNA-binding protein CbpA